MKVKSELVPWGQAAKRRLALEDAAPVLRFLVGLDPKLDGQAVLPGKSDSPSRRSAKWPSEGSGAKHHMGLIPKNRRLDQARYKSPPQPLPQNSLTQCPKFSVVGFQ